MVEEYPVPSRVADYSNATILARNVLDDVNALIEGAKLELRNLLNLYLLIDAVVLSQQCFVFGYSEEDVAKRPLYQALVPAAVLQKVSEVFETAPGEVPGFLFAKILSDGVTSGGLPRDWRGDAETYDLFHVLAATFLEHRDAIRKDFDATGQPFERYVAPVNSRARYAAFLDELRTAWPEMQGEPGLRVAGLLANLEDSLRGNEVARRYTGFSITEDAFVSSMARILASQSWTTEPSLYRELAKHDRSSVMKLQRLSSRRILHVPPLATILLSRAKTRDDICAELLRMHAEYADLAREEWRVSAQLASDSLSLRDRLDIRDVREFPCATS